MKIFVSTRLTQGARSNDFCFVPEEEIVRFGFEHKGEDVDGKCGCRRAMVGIFSMKSTTTVKVVKTAMTAEEFRRLIVRHYALAYGESACAEIMANFLLEKAAEFQIGQVLERRGDKFELRQEDWDEFIEI